MGVRRKNKWFLLHVCGMVCCSFVMCEMRCRSNVVRGGVCWGIEVDCHLIGKDVTNIEMRKINA